MDEAVSRFLAGYPELQYKEDRGGIVRCKLSGHEMPCRLEVLETYITGRKFLKLKANSNFDFRSLQPFVVPSRHKKEQLFCALTNRYVNKRPTEVHALVAGKKYLRALQRYKAGTQKLFSEKGKRGEKCKEEEEEEEEKEEEVGDTLGMSEAVPPRVGEEEELDEEEDSEEDGSEGDDMEFESIQEVEKIDKEEEEEEDEVGIGLRPTAAELETPAKKPEHWNHRPKAVASTSRKRKRGKTGEGKGTKVLKMRRTRGVPQAGLKPRRKSAGRTKH